MALGCGSLENSVLRPGKTSLMLTRQFYGVSDSSGLNGLNTWNSKVSIVLPILLFCSRSVLT